MLKKKRIKLKGVGRRSQYFSSSSQEYFSSGCVVLDCVLGGGWAENKIINVVGDQSTGKTLVAIEAMINFLQKHPKGLLVFDESEATFDNAYADMIGLDIDRVTFLNSTTVEDWFRNKYSFIDRKDKSPLLYVTDSMDGISDRREMERDIGDETYGTKAKMMSEAFRKGLQTRLHKANITTFIISQLRDNIGAMFGEKKKRSGGKALDFYSSQILWLRHMAQIDKTRNKIKRVIGVDIEAYCKKNKVGMPWRKCNFPLLFNYGIDDIAASLNWMESNFILSEFTDRKVAAELSKVSGLDNSELIEYKKDLKIFLVDKWNIIEQGFQPLRGKYR